MNIHLPAILMFTRGTRFWHTAQSNSVFSGHQRTGNWWCPRHGRVDRLFDLYCPMYLTVDQQHEGRPDIYTRLHKITQVQIEKQNYIKLHKTRHFLFSKDQFPSKLHDDYWYWWLMVASPMAWLELRHTWPGCFRTLAATGGRSQSNPRFLNSAQLSDSDRF